MNRKPTRFKLHREEGNPSTTFKVEFWKNKVLVFGLTDKPEDYFVFDTFEDVLRFVNNNFA